MEIEVELKDSTKTEEEIIALKTELNVLTQRSYQIDIDIITNIDSVKSAISDLDSTSIQMQIDLIVDGDHTLQETYDLVNELIATTPAGQDLINDKLQETSDAIDSATESAEDYQKQLDKIRLDKLISNADESLKDILADIDNIDAQMKFLEGGKSGTAGDLDYSIVNKTKIKLDTPEQAVAEYQEENPLETAESKTPVVQKDSYVAKITEEMEDLNTALNDSISTYQNNMLLLSETSGEYGASILKISDITQQTIDKVKSGKSELEAERNTIIQAAKDAGGWTDELTKQLEIIDKKIVAYDYASMSIIQSATTVNNQAITDFKNFITTTFNSLTDEDKKLIVDISVNSLTPEQLKNAMSGLSDQDKTIYAELVINSDSFANKTVEEQSITVATVAENLTSEDIQNAINNVPEADKTLFIDGVVDNVDATSLSKVWDALTPDQKSVQISADFTDMTPEEFQKKYAPLNEIAKQNVIKVLMESDDTNIKDKITEWSNANPTIKFEVDFLAVELAKEEAEEDTSSTHTIDVVDNATPVIVGLDNKDTSSTHTIKVVTKGEEIPEYVNGTDSHPGGPAIVGHGKELIKLPNGKLLLSDDKPQLIDLPKGSEVYPNEETEELLKTLGIPGYEDGTGGTISGLPTNFTDMSSIDLATFKLLKYQELMKTAGEELAKLYAKLDPEQDGIIEDNQTNRDLISEINNILAIQQQAQIGIKETVKEIYDLKVEIYKVEQETSNKIIDNYNSQLKYHELLSSDSDVISDNIKIFEEQGKLIESLSLQKIKQSQIAAEALLKYGKDSDDYRDAKENYDTTDSELSQAINSRLETAQNIGQLQAESLVKSFNDTIANSETEISILGSLDTDAEKDKAIELTKTIGDTLQDELATVQDKLEPIKLKYGSLEDFYNSEDFKNMIPELQAFYRKYYDSLQEQENDTLAKIESTREKQIEQNIERINRPFVKKSEEINKLNNDIQSKLDIASIKNPDETLKLTEDLYNSEKNSNQNIQDNITTLTNYRDTLIEGSDEWIKVNEQIDEQNEKLNESNVSLVKMAENVGKLSAESLTKSINKTIENIETKISILGNLDTDAEIDLANEYTQKIGEELQKGLEEIQEKLQPIVLKYGSIDNYFDSGDFKSLSETEQARQRAYYEGLQDEENKYLTKIESTREKQIKQNIERINKPFIDISEDISASKNDIQSELDILNVTNPDDYANTTRLTEELYNNELLNKGNIQDNISALTNYRDTLVEGSDEWEKVNDEINEQNELLDSSNLTLAQIVKKIQDIKLDSIKNEIEEFNKTLDNFSTTLGDIQNKLDLIKLWKPNDFNSIITLTKDLINTNTEEMSTVSNNILYYQEKRNNAVGEEEWNAWNDALKQAYKTEEELIMRNANLRKEQLQNEFNQQYEQIEKLVFNGSTEEDEKKKLQDKREELEKYIDGLEKSYSLEQLRNDLAKTERDTGRNIDDFDAEISAMELSEKISASEYETLKKKIDLKKKEIALDELRSNKTIRQLTKNADGIWNYEYSVDQDAIDQAQDEYTQAQIDFINYNEDLNLQSQEDELNDKSEYLAEIKKIQENALNGQYDTQEEFVNAMQELNNKLGIDYKGVWTEIVSAQLNANGQLSGQLITMKSSYSTFVTDMTTLSTSLSSAITNSALAMQNAVTSMASAIQRYNDMLAQQEVTRQQASQTQASSAQQARSDTSYESQIAEMTANNANGIPNVNTNKVWNVGYSSSQSATPNVVVTDSNGNVVPVDITRTNDSNFAVTNLSGYQSGVTYTISVDGAVQQFTASSTGSYKDGGVIDFTGVADVHGSPSHSEVAFNSTDAKKLYDIVRNLPSLSSIIPQMDTIKNWLPDIKLPDFSGMFNGNNQTSQVFNIDKLVFPEVSSSKEIENALLSLSRLSLQYGN